MGFFDRFKPSAPTPPKIADSQKDKEKSVLAAGSIFYVKWTNQQATMSDTAKFYNEHERDIFINDCRRQGYYVSTWHESLHKQVADEVAKIKAELLEVQEQEINRYKYLYAERNADYIQIKARYENVIKDIETMQAQQVEQKEQEQSQIIAAKENAKSILRALNPAQIEELLEQLEDNPEFELLEGAAQVRLIKYYANKILHI